MTTTKLREAHRQKILLDNTHVDSLLKCQCSACLNSNNYCYEIDSIHLKITAPHMKTWSMSINDTKAELEVHPDGLIATLIPSKAGTGNPL